jgi:hypothetical protein
LLFCHRVFAAPELVGFQHLGRVAGKGQRYSSPENRLFEVNIWLLRAAKTSTTMLRRNHPVRRPRLEKVIAVAAAKAIVFQVTVLAYHLKPFSGISISTACIMYNAAMYIHYNKQFSVPVLWN